jgi:hypothetical protein
MPIGPVWSHYNGPDYYTNYYMSYSSESVPAGLALPSSIKKRARLDTPRQWVPGRTRGRKL